jgi:protein gp37
MGLNKIKAGSNMYQELTNTWNPIGGQCPHECAYCSTNKFYYPHLIAKYSGEPRLIESELKTNLGKDNFIFVCAQNDLFAEGIEYEWIQKIIEHCCKYDNQYLFQTKNPIGFNGFSYPEKSKFCITIETNRYYKSYMGKCIQPQQRIDDLIHIPMNIDFITIEPIMDFDLEELVYMIQYACVEQVWIGADSGRNNLFEPPKEKILELISELEKFTKVVQKSNLTRLLK